MVQTTRRILAATAALTLAVPVAAQESYAVSGDHVAIYNLAGRTEVVGAGGGAVQVQVTRGGADGDQLDIRVGRYDLVDNLFDGASIGHLFQALFLNNGVSVAFALPHRLEDFLRNLS